MSQKKIISSDSTISNVGSEVQIYTFYNGDLAVSTVKGFITEDVGRKNGIKHIEGELLIQFRRQDYKKKIDFSLNDKGELIAIGKDASKYQLDAPTGELQFIVEE